MKLLQKKRVTGSEYPYNVTQFVYFIAMLHDGRRKMHNEVIIKIKFNI